MGEGEDRETSIEVDGGISDWFVEFFEEGGGEGGDDFGGSGIFRDGSGDVSSDDFESPFVALRFTCFDV
jgi:hypothetical protein